MQRCAGNVFHVFNDSNKATSSVCIGFTGRKTDTAVTHDECGNAVVRSGAAKGVPSGLSVHVRVHIHPAWGQQFALGIDFFVAFGSDIAHCSDLAIIDGEVTSKCGLARTIDYVCITDYQIVHVYRLQRISS